MVIARRHFLRMLGAGATTVGAATLGTGLTSACAPAGPAGRDTVRIGFVTPATGALAPFGAADRFAIDTMTRHFARDPINVGGRSQQVEVVVRDSQSNANRAADLAADLISNGGIHLMLVGATAVTATPVSDRCEAGGMPCLATATPWQPWFYGRAGRTESPFRWTFNFFWGIDDVEAVYADMWDQLDTNRTCAGLWPDDPEGRSWSNPGDGFPDALARRGYTVLAPDPYAAGTPSFARLIRRLTAGEPDILVGVPAAADFSTFWRQAVQAGFRPEVATIGRALLFPSGVEALGELGKNLGTEVWWSPGHPFSSSLTGQTARQLADSYTVATGSQWTQPLGFSHALFEVAAKAFSEVPAVEDRAGLAAAISRMKIDTMVGPLDWTGGPAPNVASTPLVGGQWRPGTDSPFELTIVSNRRGRGIPTGGVVERLRALS